MAKRIRRLMRKRPRKLSSLSKNYKHPYATRSKKLINSESVTNCDGQEKALRKLSENSVIFLGAFRKIPQLIDLEMPTTTTTTMTPATSTSYPYQELREIINVHGRLKFELMDCQGVQ